MKYIDIHTHVFPDAVAPKVVQQLSSYYHAVWTGLATVNDLLASMAEAQICRSVIFSSATKPEQVPVINDYIASLCRKYPERFIGFGTLHPDFPDMENEMTRIRELGLRGLKFHPDFQRFPIDDPRMMKAYRLAGSDLPVLFHVGDPVSDFSHPRRAAHLLELFPEMQLIAAHMGGYGVWEEAWKYLIGKNCYLDISSTFQYLSREEKTRMIRAHGVGKVFFASDYPAIRQTQAQEDVHSLNLTEEELEQICFRNAETLFGCIF